MDKAQKYVRGHFATKKQTFFRRSVRKLAICHVIHGNKACDKGTALNDEWHGIIKKIVKRKGQDAVFI